MSNYDTIIGIDAGLSNGGISVFRKGVIKNMALKKLRTRENIAEHLKYWRDISENPIVFIEKTAQLRPQDMAANPFIASVMQKLTRHYAELITIIEGIGMSYVEVHPRTWQGNNGLSLYIKGEDKEDRKKRYKTVAAHYHPEIKITLWNADAILLVVFGRKKLKVDPKWIKQNLKEVKNKLF